VSGQVAEHYLAGNKNYIIMEYIIQRVANNLCIQPERLYINYLQLKCNVKRDNSNMSNVVSSAPRYDWDSNSQL
jgi:hypothetical protein